MSAQRFKIVDVNPNDTIGGGGCACSPEKVTDCTGPFAVFFATEMGDTPLSPHNVLGCKCLLAAADAVRTGEVASVSHGPEDEAAVPGSHSRYAGDPYAPSVRPAAETAVLLEDDGVPIV